MKKRKPMKLLTLLLLFTMTSCATGNVWEVPTRIKQPDKMCAATTMVHAIMAEPKPRHLNDPLRLIKTLDGISKSRSSDHVAEIACKLGYAKTYKFIPSVDRMIDALEHGPVILTLAMFHTMEDPEDDFWYARGKLLGYHTVLVTGYNHGVFKITNTWGKFWGTRGDVRMWREDMEVFFENLVYAIQLIK